MARPTTPHTQTQQDRKPEETDLEPGQIEQTAGTGPDEKLYRNHDGAQTGDNRAPEFLPASPSNLKTEPAVAAYEGSVSSRASGGEGQGISNRSAGEESGRQEKVVRDRPDVQASVNHAPERKTA